MATQSRSPRQSSDHTPVNWIRENSFLATLTAVTLLGCGALISLTVQAMTRFGDKLGRLCPGGPQASHSPEPIAFSKCSRTWRRANCSRDNTLKNWVPSAHSSKACRRPGVRTSSRKDFRDDLRAAVNLITEKAAAAGVELPKGFYLGFSQYANSLPNERVCTHFGATTQHHQQDRHRSHRLPVPP